MTSIRRVGSGISTSRAWSISSELEVTAPVQQQPMTPVEPVRRGFSDSSDFQADADGDLAGALLEDLGLTSGPSSEAGGRASGLEDPEARAALLENPHLRTFAGESTFEAAAPAYAQRLGTPQMSTPLMQARHFQQAERRAEASPADPSLDPSDILSPDAAEWELQNLDTMPSTASSKEAEDLLFLLESGDLSGLSDEELAALSDDLDMDDAAPDASGDAEGLEVSGAPEDSGAFLATLEDSGPEALSADAPPSAPSSNDFLADADDFTMEAVQAEAAYAAAYAEARKNAASEPEPSVVVAAEPADATADIEDVQDADLVEVDAAQTPPPPPLES
ncbi:hypothetical protein HRD49_14340 [Corallococcus exiguus]|uniref:hypothetical protein n=1 Tax=Corallococcus TaxID=83461 RepID=UPI000EE5E965|nr:MULTISPECIES: hypothetical protein [Corallococcus]NRD62925.1 hypothetical protein [Corallococcus exiguus]RKI09384.1 hypothetical protein D7Y15_24050 [Corallococcus sp. AB030]RUO95050.1 hypothetical protein D7Y11_00890 [Corallococcus sp. AB018]